MPCFLDQLGNLALLHRSESGVLAGQDFAGIRGVLGKSVLVHKGVVLGVFALYSGVLCFSHSVPL